MISLSNNTEIHLSPKQTPYRRIPYRRFKIAAKGY
jgi:hypothetical protein